MAFILTALGNEQNRFKIFEDKNVSYKEKMLLAKNAHEVNNKEYKYLISLVDRLNTESFLATIALMKLSLKKSVDPIGNALLRVNDRYLALTLGAMGHKEAIPYLRKTIEKNEKRFHRGMDNPVVKASYIALRTLGAKRKEIDKLPPPKESEYLSIKLESEKQDIYPNQKSTFRLTFKNKSDKPFRLDLSIFNKFKLSSPEKQIIIQRKNFLPSVSASDIFPIIRSGEEYVKYYEYQLLTKTLRRSEWPMLSPYKLLFLTIGKALGYELCIYEKDKICPVDFVYIYSSKYGNARFKGNLNFLKETKPEEYEKYKKTSKIDVYDKKTVSNTVEIRFHSESKK